MQILYPTIEPLASEVSRPFWSVMITSYNRTQYIEQAIESILAEGFTADEMQIEVIDDCSTKGNLEELVRTLGKGRVSFYRQPVNVGIYQNWNTCISRARGRWIHILSDDDLVLPGFYKAYRTCIEETNCRVVIGQSVYIDEHDQWTAVSEPLQTETGVLNNALWLLSKTNPIRTPGIVVAREAYELVGGFTNSLEFTPDWEMWTRLASKLPVAYVSRPYSLFRNHSSSETSKLVLSAASVVDSLRATQVIQTRFTDPSIRREVQQSVNSWLGNESIKVSQKLVRSNYFKAAFTHAFWALKLVPSFDSAKNVLSVGLRTMQGSLKSTFSFN